MEHILSGKQFADRKKLEELFKQADVFQEADKTGSIPKTCQGKIVAMLFFEPSTRTRMSFEAAALKLGAQVISVQDAAKSSTAVKGETLEDIARITSGYVDAIVLRHPQIGAAERAASTSSVPVINAGDGTNEHPTQALLDIFTMQKELGSLDGKIIAFMGDHRSGRTLHSMIPLLALYRVKLLFISPKALSLPEGYKQELIKAGIEFEEMEDSKKALGILDVLYIARIMKERFASEEEYERLKDSYVTNLNTLKEMKPDAVVMAALPRVGEIDPAIDSDPRAAYFREAKNGLYVRMALLKEVLGK